MKRRTKILLGVAAAVPVLAAAAFALFVGWSPPPLPGFHLDRIRMPDGFSISVWSDAVPGARSMTWGERTLFVGTRPEGRVYALRDEDGDGRAERVWTVASGLDRPNGVAFRDGSLYVAEISRILRYDEIESKLDAPPEPTVVHDGLPKEGHHGWKFIAFGPDGRLYVPVGAPGDAVWRQDDARFASILRESEDRTSLEVFASGVRNTVGFDWHPETGELWFTDNGRDWLGDDAPADEMNRAPKAGLHFGYPFLHAKDVRDPKFWARRPEALRFTEPETLLGPHVAALGMRFYGGSMFPPRYRGAIFIAEHGSWNRTVPLGYRVTVVSLNEGRARYEVFAEGWLWGPAAWGRPVDAEVAPDGALLVSDDRKGAIYRIAYRAPD